VRGDPYPIARGGIVTAPNHLPCVCGHLDVLHNISPTSGRRTGCSISDGPKATPCGCKTFEAAPDDGGLFDLPDTPHQGGAHL
jgi:hypothetical protein